MMISEKTDIDRFLLNKSLPLFAATAIPGLQVLAAVLITVMQKNIKETEWIKVVWFLMVG
jgi:hypothetical protein